MGSDSSKVDQLGMDSSSSSRWEAMGMATPIKADTEAIKVSMTDSERAKY